MSARDVTCVRRWSCCSGVTENYIWRADVMGRLVVEQHKRGGTTYEHLSIR